MSKLMIVAILGATLLGACAPCAQPYAAYAYRPSYHRHHVVYVDGMYYDNSGIVQGPPPPDTLIPTDDPEVGRLTPPSDTPTDQSFGAGPQSTPVADPL